MLILVSSALAFAPRGLPLLPARRASTACMSSDAASAWLPNSLSSIVDGLGLTEKADYAADLGCSSFNVGGSSGSIKSYEGPGAPNVAWCSGFQLQGPELTHSSITVYCGPLSDVPHLIASSGVSTAGEGAVNLFIDFRVRAECGYTPSGVYEEPTSREAFAMGGNRKDFADAFFTEDAIAWRESLLAIPGAEVTMPSEAEMAEMSASSLYLDLKLPLNKENAAAAATACEQATARWLGWMQNSEQNKRNLPAGAKQTGVYQRDTKVRANLYGVMLKRYNALFGDQGQALTAADVGPLDEAYVGGGS